MTTPMPGQAAAREERGYRRSRRSCLGPRAGPSENIRRTVTFFVERYQESMGTLFPFFRDRFGKAVLFSFSPPTGATVGKKGTIMKKILALVLALTMALTLAACSGDAPETTLSPYNALPGLEDGVLTVGMECAYAPYNWTQMDDSNGAVPIANNPGSYANGYDVMIAKKICEAYGWKLEVMALEWGGLSPALAAGTIDVAIAGQSMTAERMAEVDMAGPYYYATIVCVTTADSHLASATCIADLSGTCTSQSGTIWYDTCLPQIDSALIQSPADSAPAMIMALESGMVDFICTDLPTANGAVAKNPNLVVLNFAGTDGDFQFDSEEIRAENVNIGVSVKKGNSDLQKAMNDVLNAMTEADFNALMDEAIAVQPAI